jgi:hypothetical protein
MGAPAKIHRARCQHDPDTRWDRHHEAAALTARNTAMSVLVSTPLATRTTVPPKSISISATRARAGMGGGAPGIIVASTIGAKAGPIAGPWPDFICNAARRQLNTWLALTCQRRATCATIAPNASAATTAFCRSDQRRRRPGPVRTSTRRETPLASSLTSSKTSVRSLLLLHNRESHSASSRKNGRRAPPTVRQRATYGACAKNASNRLSTRSCSRAFRACHSDRGLLRRLDRCDPSAGSQIAIPPL